ncbi:MAG: efflux RND transporter periplasmic adaptor subunit [Elusimicrobia bacterium]|nr:efflux RND transporter periplasmic adaptor subunit [Elusimicrobiota bacterium]
MRKKYLVLSALAVFLAGGGITFHLWRRHPAQGHGVLQKAGYYCPMHPAYTSDKPGDCPICNMKLIPMEENATAQETAGAVTLTQQRRQLIGMKSELVQRRHLSFTVRASGRVAYDPELYNAIAEYREAVGAKEKTKENPWPDVLERSEALVRASLSRLRQLGLSEAQIEEIAQSKEEPTNLLLGNSQDSVWVYAQIYEYEIGKVKPGQKVEVTTPAYPGRKFHGIIKAIDPILSAETRSLKVRIELPNPEGLLKLEMYVNAQIRADLGFKLALAEEALIDTGERQVVFIDLGEGRLEPREVRVGQEADGYYEILSGIREGERVVTSANFLIDSESRLKAAISKTKEKHRH